MTDLSVHLGPNQYGKAENHVVRIYRDTARHEIKDVNVSTSLRGDFSAAHLQGDQADVLPTDTQKNTCFAYAKEHGIGAIEDYALTLGRHFVNDVAPVAGARIEVDEYGWTRVSIDGSEHDHTFVRTGQEVRTTVVTVDGKGEDQKRWIVSGFKDLIILKSTGSEFADFLVDHYTTLEPTHDRIMATSLVARWRYTDDAVAAGLDWDATYAAVKAALVEKFATVHSLALQQTLWEMGKAALERVAGLAEIKLSAPNKHHFLVDLAPFALENPGEVFYAADRPYGLIQASVVRDGEEEAGLAWYTVPGFA